MSAQAIARAVEEFPGVPHRLELVARINEVDYYNDSIATTPQRTLAALHSFGQTLVLLLGGASGPNRALADPLPNQSTRANITAAAAGGCMLVRRSALASAGGIASIRGALIDVSTRGPAANLAIMGAISVLMVFLGAWSFERSESA